MLVAESPHNIVGPTEIEVKERGIDAKGDYRNVGVGSQRPRLRFSKASKH